ncbi:hypothetical protein GEOBC_01518 [Geobacteraceae bacterium]|nr:hypothetical protein GEOBC_01518 [Geobacteraceae bacterium]
MNSEPATVAVDAIAGRIVTLRGQRVILDADLATLYGVETKRLNEQVRRNSERFPGDFMFALEQDEWEALRSQFATLKTGRGQHRKYLPYVFTEHGAIMAATVLNSPRAVEVSIFVVRAFVQLRELLAGHKELAKRLDELEARIERKLMTHDQAIAGILDAIRQLMAPPPTKKRPIGFVTGEKK